MTPENVTPTEMLTIKEAALEFAAGNKKRTVDELVEFLKIPSISTQPQMANETVAAAQWLASAMKDAGLNNIMLIETAGHPLVYADWLGAGAGAPTVLIYGHYDVQPPDPLELWNSPPFEPKLTEEYIYARGASDDKGQVYIHVKAVEAYLKSSGSLPVNVKFIVEGEEESGGKSLEAFVPRNQELLAADTVLVSDTHIAGKDTPSLVYGLRGMCYVLLDISGPSHDLHSGSYGGAIDNPLNVLGHIIARLKDADGRVQIPGFYDKVRPLDDSERKLIAQSKITDEELLTETGAPDIWGEPEYSILERLGARPTLDVNGIIGGYTGAGAKTVLPSKVHAKISMRLVADQDPVEIFELFREYVQELAPPSVIVKVTYAHGALPCIIDTTIPEIQSAAQAYEDVFGLKPIFMREGGSIPVISLFQQYLGLQTVLMGFGLGDDHIHSPNERMYLPNLHRGVETVIHYLHLLSQDGRA